MRNNAEDVIILDYFRVNHRRVKFLQPTGCFWEPPEENDIQLCCDGAARGNPGVAGAGVVERNARCLVLGAMSIGLGVTTNYLAEFYGILVGMEWAVRGELGEFAFGLILIVLLKLLRAPIFLGLLSKGGLQEENFSADAMAKRGCLLNEEEGLHYDGRPDFLISVEFPNVAYYRFK
ncbi:uncharacterized protein LOC113296346 [Papaver somniferum]|uniref:uncharacterized protein LOC113296346 n=1 Tax=Papaver somniferum TaxID=3469 RepID=UPI000E6FB572|nr:uncharacterized protein LOC113296346 [Papaver somniferum]